jgi:hypothetical protein
MNVLVSANKFILQKKDREHLDISSISEIQLSIAKESQSKINDSIEELTRYKDYSIEAKSILFYFLL